MQNPVPVGNFSLVPALHLVLWALELISETLNSDNLVEKSEPRCSRVDGNPFKLERSASYLIYGIVTTIPLIFGAVHPIVLGCYVFVMLAGLGGWLLLDRDEGGTCRFSLWSVVPIILFVYLIVQSLPLSFEWIEIVSPNRAERVRMVNELAGTNQQQISLSDNGMVGFYRSFFLLALMV